MDEATHKKSFKPINIQDLFFDKNPAVARWISGFIYRLFSRIWRIDFFNDPINKHGAQLVRDHTYLIPDEPLKNFSYLHSENSRP